MKTWNEGVDPKTRKESKERLSAHYLRPQCLPFPASLASSARSFASSMPTALRTEGHSKYAWRRAAASAQGPKRIQVTEARCPKPLGLEVKSGVLQQPFCIRPGLQAVFDSLESINTLVGASLEVNPRVSRSVPWLPQT